MAPGATSGCPGGRAAGCDCACSFATRYSCTCPRPHPASTAASIRNDQRGDDRTLSPLIKNFTLAIYKRWTRNASGLTRTSRRFRICPSPLVSDTPSPGVAGAAGWPEQGRTLAPYVGAHPARVWIVPVFVLYSSCILPVFLARFPRITRPRPGRCQGTPCQQRWPLLTRLSPPRCGSSYTYREKVAH